MMDPTTVTMKIALPKTGKITIIANVSRKSKKQMVKA